MTEPLAADFGAFRLGVPGNLLLMGEYAVTEEGGLGIALATEPRLWVDVQPAPDWELRGLWPGGGETWRPGEDKPSLLSVVFRSVSEHLKPNHPRPARISIDSTPFFDTGGRKIGLGSSAACAAGLTAALLLLAGQSEDALASKALLPATLAHRQAQGGRGSGYDVAASLFGGWGLFHGGASPGWSPLTPRSVPALGLVRGPSAVRTVSAVEAFRRWKASHPFEFWDFYDRSQALCSSWSRSRNWERGLPYLREARLLGESLGERIGVPSHLAPEMISGLPLGASWVLKALGAGNELGLLAGPRGEIPGSLQEVRVAPEGIILQKGAGL